MAQSIVLARSGNAAPSSARRGPSHWRKGEGSRPAANDTIKNGVYQDFGTYVRTIPTRWSGIRSSRVNNMDAVIAKSFEELIALGQYR